MGEVADDMIDQMLMDDLYNDEGYFIEAKYELSSELAHLLRDEQGEPIWIPKSQTLRLLDNGIIITDWLAAKRGLIEEDEDDQIPFDDLDDGIPF